MIFLMKLSARGIPCHLLIWARWTSEPSEAISDFQIFRKLLGLGLQTAVDPSSERTPRLRFRGFDVRSIASTLCVLIGRVRRAFGNRQLLICPLGSRLRRGWTHISIVPGSWSKRSATLISGSYGSWNISLNQAVLYQIQIVQCQEFTVNI